VAKRTSVPPGEKQYEPAISTDDASAFSPPERSTSQIALESQRVTSHTLMEWDPLVHEAHSKIDLRPL
jgi:hypothetical protein